MDAVSGYGFDSIGIQSTFQFLLFCGLKHLLFTLGEFTIGQSLRFATSSLQRSNTEGALQVFAGNGSTQLLLRDMKSQ